MEIQMKRTKLTIILIMGLILSQPSMAQSNDFDREYFTSEDNLEGRLTLSIPFGATPNSNKNSPRFELGLHQSQSVDPSKSFHNSYVQTQGFKDQDYRGVTIGLTLDKQPDFLLNRQTYQFIDEQLGLSKGAKTGLIIVGTAVVVTALTVATCLEPDIGCHK